MIIAADWVFPVSSPPLYRHAIEIRGGNIYRIRPSGPTDSDRPGTCVLPGLVNAHTHLAYTALRNLYDDYSFFGWIRKLTEIKYGELAEEHIVASTRLGILECLRSGITTVADMSDFEVALRTLSRSPLRWIFYWEIFGVEKERARKSWQDLQEIFPRLRRQYETDRLQIGVSPHACYTVRPELYRKIARWAHPAGVPVSFHVAESKAEEEFISSGSGVISDFLRERAADWNISAKSSVSHLEKTGIFRAKPLLAHVVHVSQEDMEILAKYPISIAHCPKSNAKFGHGIAPVYEMRNKGISVGIGSDSAASNNRFDLFEEARFALFSQRFLARKMILTEQEILEMITLEGARALNLEGRVGSLEAGKAADLIVLGIPPYYSEPQQVLRHIVYNSSASDVLTTIVAGQEIGRAALEKEIRDVEKDVSKLLVGLKHPANRGPEERIPLPRSERLRFARKSKTPDRGTPRRR